MVAVKCQGLQFICRIGISIAGVGNYVAGNINPCTFHIIGSGWQNNCIAIRNSQLVAVECQGLKFIHRIGICIPGIGNYVAGNVNSCTFNIIGGCGQNDCITIANAQLVSD